MGLNSMEERPHSYYVFYSELAVAETGTKMVDQK